MDNFMETIAPKFSATDMIRANAQADAALLDDKKEQIMRFEAQMTKVDSALTDIREVNMKNLETAQNVQDLAKASTDGINKTVDESLAKIARIQESTDVVDAIKTLDEKMDSVKTLDEKLDEIKALEEKMEALHKELEEFAHTDHVKIYRNVQASVIEELEKQTKELKEAQKKKGALVPLVIASIVFSAASFALLLLMMFGLI